MDDYLSYYGLQQEPFSDSGAFFGGAGRQEALDQVQHYCQFSSGAIVLEGRPGLGKSLLLQQLAQLHPSALPLSFVAAPVTASAEQILSSLATELGMPLPEDNSAGAMASQLRHQLQVGGQQALIIIDDAHNLGDQVLSALLSLLQGQEPGAKSSNLVLAGDNGLATRLDSFELVDILINDVQLLELSLAETGDYIARRLEQAGFDGDMPFSAEELDQLWRESKGCPGAINKLAEHLLVSKLYRRPAKTSGLPMGHMMLAVALLAVLIFSYLYKDVLLGGSELEPEDQLAHAAEGLVGASASAFADDTVDTVDSGGGAGEVKSAAAPSQSSADTAEQIGDRQASELKDVVASMAAAQLGQPGEGAGLGGVVSPVSSAKVQAQAKAPMVDIGLPVKTIVDQKKKSAGLDKKLVQAATVIAKVNSAPDPGPEPDLDDDTISADEEYLLALDETDFVLQLLAAPSRQGARQAVAAMANRGQVRVYPRSKYGKTWYVLVLPGFNSGADARRAAKTYNSDVWPRNVSHVHQDIKAYRGI